MREHERGGVQLRLAPVVQLPAGNLRRISAQRLLIGFGTLKKKASSAAVGAGRGAKLAAALGSFVGIAAPDCGALRLRIGHAAGGEGQ
jgi:hypothetical protein